MPVPLSPWSGWLPAGPLGRVRRRPGRSWPRPGQGSVHVAGPAAAAGLAAGRADGHVRRADADPGRCGHEQARVGLLTGGTRLLVEPLVDLEALLEAGAAGAADEFVDRHGRPLDPSR